MFLMRYSVVLILSCLVSLLYRLLCFLAEIVIMQQCVQYVFGAIFRDIHIWSATGASSAGSSGYHSLTSGNGGASGQALATLPTTVGVVADFFTAPNEQVGVHS